MNISQFNTNHPIAPEVLNPSACCKLDAQSAAPSLCEQVWGIWQQHAQHLRQFLQQRTREKMLTDDLLSDVLLKTYKNCERLAEVREVRAWLTRIAQNALTDHYRKAKANGLPVEEVLVDENGEGMLPEQRLATCLGEMLTLLPEEDRLPLQWADLEGLPQKEVAQRLGLSISGAKSRIQRARIKLKEQIEACCQVEINPSGGVADYYPKKDC